MELMFLKFAPKDRKFRGVFKGHRGLFARLGAPAVPENLVYAEAGGQGDRKPRTVARNGHPRAVIHAVPLGLRGGKLERFEAFGEAIHVYGDVEVRKQQLHDDDIGRRLGGEVELVEGSTEGGEEERDERGDVPRLAVEGEKEEGKQYERVSRRPFHEVLDKVLREDDDDGEQGAPAYRMAREGDEGVL